MKKRTPGATWLPATFCLATFTGTSTPAQAFDFDIFAEPGQWVVLASPFTQHFRPSPEHRRVYALGVERHRDDGRMGGFSLFRNSFGQPSAYGYVGQRYTGLMDVPQWTAQWTAGLIYGYKGEFKDKVGYNLLGFSPAVVVTSGWQFTKNFSTDVHLLGDAGLMLQLTYRLD